MGLKEQVKEYVDLRKSMFDQGFLDNQFIQLQQLEDEDNPNFVAEIIDIFFNDSERILNLIYHNLSDELNVDFKKLDAHVHQLKGSSSSIGAQRIKNACIIFRGFCDLQDVKSCQTCVHQVKHEYYIIRENLEKLVTMKKEIVDAGGSIPPMV